MSETLISSAKFPLWCSWDAAGMLVVVLSCILLDGAAGMDGTRHQQLPTRAAGPWGEGLTCDPQEDGHSPCYGSRGSTTLEVTLGTAGDSR